MQVKLNVAEYFLELLRCALHDRTPAPKPQEVDWADIYQYAKEQSLSTMVYSVIKNTGAELAPELRREWATRYAKNLVKFSNQEHECERICNALSAAGFENMPLKGSVIRKLFPSPEFREMGDLDILVKPETAEAAHEMMLADGYTYLPSHTTSFNREYQKLPYMDVEIHTFLTHQEGEMFTYFSDWWDRALPPEKNLTYKVSWSDCYIFLMAHAYRHFSHSGTGVRSVIDVYVMNQALKDELDRDYVSTELKKLKIDAFASMIERLADCWFAEEKQDVPGDLLSYHYRILGCGTYGDGDDMRRLAFQHIQSGKSFRAAKRTMAVKKIFPSYAYMKTMYPVLGKLPFLLPLFWVVRWFATLFTKPKKISAYFSRLKKLSLTGDKKE